MPLRQHQGRVLAVVVIVTTTASVGMNVWFWASRSSGLVEAALSGSIAGALDIVKVVAAGTVAGLWTRGAYGAASIVTGLLVLGIVSSGLASIGFFYSNRAATVDVGLARGKVFAGRLETLARKRSERAVLGPLPGSAEVLAQQEQVLARVPLKHREQKRCAAGVATNDCVELRELAVTLERARRGEALDAEIKELEQQTAGSTQDAAHAGGDGQVAMLARLLDQPTARVESILAFLFALLVEGVTAGAPFLLSVLRGETVPLVKTEPVEPVVEAFVGSLLTFAPEKNITEAELVAALRGFCAARGVDAPAGGVVTALVVARGGVMMKLKGEAGFARVGFKNRSN